MTQPTLDYDDQKFYETVRSKLSPEFIQSLRGQDFGDPYDQNIWDTLDNFVACFKHRQPTLLTTGFEQKWLTLMQNASTLMYRLAIYTGNDPSGLYSIGAPLLQINPKEFERRQSTINRAAAEVCQAFDDLIETAGAPR